MEFSATAITLKRFAGWLSNRDVTGRKIIDQTGINGLYDFRFKYADPSPGQIRDDANRGNSLPDPSAPSITKPSRNSSD